MTKKIEAAIAVTGAGGFLGGVITRMLAASGAQVHALARTPIAVDGDVRSHHWDPVLVDASPMPRLTVDAVIDCAACLPSREADGSALKRVNAALVAGSIELAARGGGRLIYMSSQSVYGRPTGARIDETTPLAPLIPYGEAKRDAEDAIRAAVEAGRLRGAAVLRLPAVVGPGAHDNFPANTAAKLLRGDPVTAFNPDAAYNAVVGAEPLARLAIALAQSVDGLVTLCPAATPAATVREAVEALAAGLGVIPRLSFEDAPYGSPVIDPAAAIRQGLEAQPTAQVLRTYGREMAQKALEG